MKPSKPSKAPASATRILYITAHPDDESAAVLTYLARGLHADVALLSSRAAKADKTPSARSRLRNWA